MKQTRDEYSVLSTVPKTESIAMGIRTEDMAHIMGVLTDLYADKLAALIREYSTNALDANVEAGNDAPIRVTLPTALTPFLTIADNGVGLSAEDIREVYSQYGRSTKRESNDVVGMLGLGCKSALTYTSQFTVTSVKDGVKTVVIVSREEDGSGSMTPIESGATDEPNGTEVKVAINRSDYYRCEQLAVEFYSVWAEGTVLVNGQAPKRFDGLKISDDLYVTQEGKSRVVMGNVPYPAPQLDGLCPMGAVIAYVPIGAVNFPPSRESLMDTKQTKQTIETIRKRFESEARKAIQREIDKATSPAAAMRVAVEWDRYLPGGSKMPTSIHTATGATTPYTYRGSALPAYIEAADPQKFITSGNSHYRIGASSETSRVFAAEWPGAVFVRDYQPTKFVANHKHKLRKAAAAAGIPENEVKLFVCVRGPMPSEQDQPGVKFIEDKRILDWEEVRKIKLTTATTSANGYTNRIPGSYDLYTEDGFQEGIPGEKIRQDKPIFYFNGNKWQYGSRYQGVMEANFDKFTVVLLRANRIAKFCRNVPKAKTVREALEAKRSAWIKTLTVDQRDALSLADDYLTSDLKRLDAPKVDDPALKRAIKLAGMDTKAIREKRDKFARVLGRYSVNLDSKIGDPLDKYPLFDLSGKPMDHVYDYLNWHYNNAIK